LTLAEIGMKYENSKMYLVNIIGELMLIPDTTTMMTANETMIATVILIS